MAYFHQKTDFKFSGDRRDCGMKRVNHVFDNLLKVEEEVIEYSPAGRVKRKASKKVRYREYEDDDSMSFDLDKIMQEVEEQEKRYYNRHKTRAQG